MPSVTFEKRIKEARTKSDMTEWVQRMYAETDRVLHPLKPFILIRTLPRSTITSGGILMPEKQNKPNIEAVVLAVYEPYWEKVESNIREDGKTEDISVYVECDVKVGDHIVLPHHVGLPDSFLDEKEYRIIREDDAISTLQYRDKGWLRKELRSLVSQYPDRYHEAVDELLKHYDVIPKVIHSRTLSGV